MADLNSVPTDSTAASPSRVRASEQPSEVARSSCAVAYRSPASVPSSTMTIEGGMICPSVPDAVITPVASSGE